MEGAFSVGWTCLARGEGRCPRVGGIQLLQDTPTCYSSRGWWAGGQKIPRG